MLYLGIQTHARARTHTHTHTPPAYASTHPLSAPADSGHIPGGPSGWICLCQSHGTQRPREEGLEESEFYNVDVLSYIILCSHKRSGLRVPCVLLRDTASSALPIATSWSARGRGLVGVGGVGGWGGKRRRVYQEFSVLRTGKYQSDTLSFNCIFQSNGFIDNHTNAWVLRYPGGFAPRPSNARARVRRPGRWREGIKIPPAQQYPVKLPAHPRLLHT